MQQILEILPSEESSQSKTGESKISQTLLGCWVGPDKLWIIFTFVGQQMQKKFVNFHTYFFYQELP